MDFPELVRHLCAQPGMYVGTATLATVTAYLNGYDHARDGGPLCGFREWLIVRLNEGNNLAWPGLAPRLFPTLDGWKDADHENETIKIGALGMVLDAFFAFRRERGLPKIFHAYGKWLLRRQWYTGPLRQH